MLIPLGGYAGGGSPDWRPGATLFIMGVLGFLGWTAVANFCDWIVPTWAGYLIIAIPILAILVNGWIDMWQDARALRI